MAAPKWTEAEDTMLRDLTAKGFSSARIAQRLLDRGRNAIIGRQHRLGLKGGPKSGPKPRANAPSSMPLKPPRDHRDHATINVARLNRLRAEMEAPAPEPKQTPDGAPVPLMITLLDLTDQMCRWPVNSPERGGEFLFCAHEKGRGSPYCSFHERIAWTGRPVSRATRPTRRAA